MPTFFGPTPHAVRLRIEPLEARETPAALAGLDYDAGRAVVTFSGLGPTPAEAAALTAVPFAADVTGLGLGSYSVDLKPGVSVAAAVAALGQLPGVADAQPDYAITATALPNDPSVGGQWQYQAAGAGGISAAAAWGTAHGTGRTIVAVIDSGVDTTHPDLAANLWHNPGEVAGNGTDDDGDGFVDDVYGANFVSNTGNVNDDYGHGTHVAGIVGAVGNNGVGVSGVAWTTQIMALKFMDSSGVGYSSNAIRAIDYAIAHGAKVISASWGGSPYDASLAAAIGRAQAAGVIFVASAGNSATDDDTAPFYPAGYVSGLSNVVTVAATDSSGNLASFSNYGAGTVTLAAPGVNILSTTAGGGYGLKSGTSMAAPMVAGALAVVWDEHPNWTYQQVIAKLKASVDVLPSLVGKTQTGGRLDLAKLVDAPAASPPPVSPPVSPPVTSPPVVVSPPPVTTTGAGPRVSSAGFSGPKAGMFDRITVTFDRAVDPLTFTPADVTVTGPAGAATVSAVIAVGGSGGRQFTLVFSKNQTAAGTYTAVIGPDVRDAAGNRMDQDGNGTGGQATDTYTLTGVLGTATSPPVTSVPPVSPPPVTTTGAGPRVTQAGFGGPRTGVFDRVTVAFDRAADPGSFTPADVTVTGPAGAVRVSAVLPVAGSGNRQFYLVFSKDQTATGSYTAVVGPDIRDISGNRMDQDGNGTGGQATDTYTLTGTLGAVVAKATAVSPPTSAASPATILHGSTRGFGIDAADLGVWVGGPGRKPR